MLIFGRILDAFLTNVWALLDPKFRQKAVKNRSEKSHRKKVVPGRSECFGAWRAAVQEEGKGGCKPPPRGGSVSFLDNSHIILPFILAFIHSGTIWRVLFCLGGIAPKIENVGKQIKKKKVVFVGNRSF